eukprot:gene8734-6140_t
MNDDAPHYEGYDNDMGKKGKRTAVIRMQNKTKLKAILTKEVMVRPVRGAIVKRIEAAQWHYATPEFWGIFLIATANLLILMWFRYQVPYGRIKAQTHTALHCFPCFLPLLFFFTNAAVEECALLLSQKQFQKT